MAKKKLKEGVKVEVVSTPNGAHVGHQSEVVHVGEDAAGDTVYILRVPIAEPYRTLHEVQGLDTSTEASFYADQLKVAD
jgi:hypothetical protein